MSAVLFLHPRGLAEPGAGWPCLLLSPQATKALTLAEAAQQLAGEPARVVAPVELFSCWSTGPWPGRRRPPLRAMGYAIEDDLSLPLESLHLVAGPLDKERRCALRACESTAFAALLGALATAELRVAALHIDADLLPAHAPCALWLFDRWLLRGEGEVRMAASASDFACLGGLATADWTPLNEPEDPPAAACKQLSEGWGTAVDLAPGRSQHRVWPWRTTGLMLAGALLLECALNWGAAWQQRQVADALQASAIAHLNTLLPEALQGQPLTQQLRALQAGAPPAEQTLAGRLQVLADTLVGGRDVKVQRIEFHAGEGWKIHLSAPAMADVERLSERAAQRQLPLQLFNASQEGGRTLVVIGLEDAS